MSAHLGEYSQVLYDVSSSYYEGRTCPLMRYGYSRDGKRGRPILVYGLLADGKGRPLAVQAYPGNTADPTTVPDQVQTLRERFGLQRVVLVGDRGMLTDTQIETLRQHQEATASYRDRREGRARQAGLQGRQALPDGDRRRPLRVPTGPALDRARGELKRPVGDPHQ